MREDSYDVVFLIFVLEVCSVLVSEKVEGEEGEQDKEHVVPFATHFPGGHLGGVRLCVPVVSTGMQPVAVVVNVEFFEVAELVQGVVLQVVGL